MTRFVHKGKNPTMLVVASSKRSEQSFMEEYIKTLSKTEGHSTLVVDKPVWEVKPKGTYSDEIFYVGLGNKFLESMVIPDEDLNNLDAYRQRGYRILEVPVDFKAKFLEDIDRNLCDFAGISSSSTNKYMSAKVVSETIKPDLQNPFPDILEVGNGKEDTAQYYSFFDMSKIPQEFMYKPLYIHLDMSISGDMTGIAGVWITGKKVSTDESQEARDLQFQVAFSTAIKAPKGFQVSFEKNRNFVRWLKQQGFNIKGVTSDTFQSYDLQQQLSAEGFECSILSVDRVNDGICQPYQYLRSAIYEKRFVMYKSNRLFDEFVDIERNINTGRVDHSPNGHKDTLDAVCGATFNASKHAAEYAFDYGESLDVTTQVNQSHGYDADVRQLTLDFEAEMQRMLDTSQHTPQPTSDNNIKKQRNDPAAQQLQNQMFLANGIIVW